MRMLLTSNGIANAAIEEALVDLLGTPIAEARVVVVIDAILGFPGDSAKLLEHLELLRSLGWAEFDVASLFAGPAELVASRLRSADVILGYGGSDLWAAHAWLSTGLAPVLAELLEEKVYIGWSAGSMIFSRGMQRWDSAGNGEEREMFGLTEVAPAVPLFDWRFIGHLGADFMPAGVEERVAVRAGQTGQQVWFIDDDSALVVRDPAEEPVLISTGHWRRYDADGSLADSR
ncbi:Type 1 glutamine amidotransferase-like domain-containing protein [Agrococcus sp. SGAir0287]|uniref:Type 1 glutamine amidotransferase-like domain-containing protein n=1 Tax=Agrococcus sp. SGAir0287 TaxID=2070347 RepID=UPI0010CD5D36|nr:Type 1 glutamine amidotransferase-like domain-containing protein [Agrococcus sp. SGAir0287]QCR20514.1 peptidase E [Agrococcus sp. SGAir0287]